MYYGKCQCGHDGSGHRVHTPGGTAHSYITCAQCDCRLFNPKNQPSDAEKYAKIFRAAADGLSPESCWGIPPGYAEQVIAFRSMDGIARMFEKIVEVENEPDKDLKLEPMEAKELPAELTGDRSVGYELVADMVRVHQKLNGHPPRAITVSCDVMSDIQSESRVGERTAPVAGYITVFVCDIPVTEDARMPRGQVYCWLEKAPSLDGEAFTAGGSHRSGAPVIPIVLSTQTNRKMKLEPMDDRLVIRQVTVKGEEKVGSIIMPEMAREKPSEGVIVAVGPGAWDNGKRVPVGLSVGDTVLYGRYSGTEVSVDGETLLIVRQGDIFARRNR